MAIYRNREVTFLAPVRTSHQSQSVTVVYKDNSHENVPLSSVKFTEDEKKALIKSYPSQFDDVATVTEDDLKAVRLGVAPPSDPAYAEMADTQVRHQKQVEENQKQVEAAKSDAEKRLNAQLKGTSAKSQVSPQSPTQMFQRKDVNKQ